MIRNMSWKRIVSIMLILIMVVNITPLSELRINAATDTMPECVTVCVKDEFGNALEDVQVSYSIFSVTTNSEIYQETVMTDGNGSCKVLGMADFIAGDLEISAEIMKKDYKKSSIEKTLITSIDENFDVVLTHLPGFDVPVEGIDVVYEEDENGSVIKEKLVNVQAEEGDKVSYSFDGENWDEDIPEESEVGDYTIYVKVEREGYADFRTQVTSYIIAKDTDIAVNPCQQTYDSEEHGIFEITGLKNGDSIELIYPYSDKEDAAEENKKNKKTFIYGTDEFDIPKIKNTGDKGSFKIRVLRNKNYNVFETTGNAVISPAEINKESVVINVATDLVYGEGIEKLVNEEIEGIIPGDTVLYRYRKENDNEWTSEEDGWSEEVPSAEDAGKYLVQVRVERVNYKTYISDEVEVNIAKKNIEEGKIIVESKEYTYDNSEHEVLKINGLVTGDKVTIQCGGEDESYEYIYSEDNKENNIIPTKKNAGTYSFNVTVDRKNYEPVSFNGECVINEADIKDISFSAREDIVYNGFNQNLLSDKIEGIKENDDVLYRYRKENANEWTNEDEGWSKEVPSAEDAGKYLVQVRVNRENYKPFTTEEKEVEIKKAEQIICFKKGNGVIEKDEIEITYTGKDEEDNKEDNKVGITCDTAKNGREISYGFEVKNADFNGNSDDIVTIGNDGNLDVKKGGYVVLMKVCVDGDDNYEEANAKKIIVIKSNEDDLIWFYNQKETKEPINDTVIRFTLGTSDVVNEQVFLEKKYEEDQGKITYSIEDENKVKLDLSEYGLELDKNNGHIRVAEGGLKKLIDSIKDNKSLFFYVNASISEGIVEYNEVKYTVYKSLDVKYRIDIRFGDDKTDIVLLDENGNRLAAKKIGQTFYYKENVYIKKDGYKVTQFKENMGEFEDSFVFNKELNEKNTYLCFKNDETGAILRPVKIHKMYVDDELPDELRVSISDNSFYHSEKDKLKISVEVKDKLSGIQLIKCELKCGSKNLSAEATGKEIKNKNHIIFKTTFEFDVEQGMDDQKPEIIVTAIDKAGNEIVENNGEFVVDTISPKVKLEIGSINDKDEIIKIDKKYYFKNDVKVNVTVYDENFSKEDFIINIVDEKGTEEVDFISEWVDDKKDYKHTNSFYIKGEGEYKIIVEEVKDSAGNNAEKITYRDKNEENAGEYGKVDESKMIVIDKTKPVVEFEDHTNDKDTENQYIKIRVKEHYFDKDRLTLNFNRYTNANMKDKNPNVSLDDEDLGNLEWISEGKDTYSITLSKNEIPKLKDGIFKDVEICSTDLAGNEGVVLNKNFIIDYTAPDSLKIDFEKESAKENILPNITFGFFKDEAEITFTVYDEVSGIDKIYWSYEKEKDSSDKNVVSLSGSRSCKQDEKDKTKFTAKITLPKEKGTQLRGNLKFYAIDKKGNISDAYTGSGEVLVVDSISPEMSVEYDGYTRQINDTLYYNKDLVIKFNVDEANFYGDDVKVSIEKDGKEIDSPKLTWEDGEGDLWYADYTIQAKEDHSNDGDYRIYVDYTDKSGNNMKTWQSDVIVIDTIKPVISVKYENENVKNQIEDNEGNLRNYFDSDQTAEITIDEHNFYEGDVSFNIVTKDVAGNELDANALNIKSSWITADDIHKIKISYPGDANYTFGITYTDLAGNQSDEYGKDYFTVDKTKPENLKISYSPSVIDTMLSNITFGFYNTKVTVTLEATDSISMVNNFKYAYVKAVPESSVNAQRIEQEVTGAQINYSDKGYTATISFDVPSDSLTGINQLNGTFDFMTIDRAGNESEYLRDSKRIVVDNITPTSTVVYNTPVRNTGNIAYYDGGIQTVITMNEANFYPEDATVTVTKDGSTYGVTPSWSDKDTDTHTGTFTLSQDGDYFVTVGYKDKSNNSMIEYHSSQMTIDTKINEAVITINGNEADGKAFGEDVVLGVAFEDKNFDSYNISMTRTRMEQKDVTVTDDFIDKKIAIKENSGSDTFDTFEKIKENDGIYTIKVSVNDKAGHTVDNTATFTVNRFGSVYEYSDYLVSLIKDGGSYVQKLKEDLIITEYNSDRLIDKSLDISLSKDGRPVDDAVYDVTPDINNEVQVGDSGWYQYKYVIKKQNFDKDGLYKLTISSKDATGNNPENMPENTNYTDNAIQFHVDSTSPEINSITGLEKKIINATGVDVNYTVYDTVGLKSVSVEVDDKEIANVTDFGEDTNAYEGKFSLSEKKEEQKVRLVVTDKAGNVTDTNSEDYESAFAFNKNVLVSTNAFVRWYANQYLFWGSIMTAAAVAAGGTGMIMFGRKKGSKKTNG